MRAVVFDRYGPPSGMRVADLPIPEPGAGEVRIRVHAAGVNAADWHIYRGDPWIARPSFGFPQPGTRGLGTDVAGVIDAVGPDVSALSLGDEVYGEIGKGSVADYAIAKASVLALKPTSLSFEEAAAVPMAALTALQGLRLANASEGTSVLVIGASGGVGHMAVQVARALGAGRVVAVCSGRNAGWVAELGADRVIDYTRESVLDADERFDVVYDTVATTPLRRLRRVMWPRAVYAPAGALGGGRMLGPITPLLRSVITGLFMSQKVAVVMATSSGADLTTIAQLIDGGQIRPHVEKVYELENYESALAMLESKHAPGKVVFGIA